MRYAAPLGEHGAIVLQLFVKLRVASKVDHLSRIILQIDERLSPLALVVDTVFVALPAHHASARHRLVTINWRALHQVV